MGSHMTFWKKYNLSFENWAG